MSKLTASMVVDLKDRTGPGARSALNNLRNFKRDSDRVARDMDRQMLDRARRQAQMRDEMMANAAATSRVVAAGLVTAGVVATKAFTDFAALERRVNRIAINAGVGADKVAPIIDNLETVAKESQVGFANAVAGLETLVASGRSLDEALAFLPSIAVTAQASGAAITDIALSADSLSGSLKIASKDMQKAFDVLVEGGKQGKFELKDMAQYLPSILSSASANGYKGVEGLEKIVAMMQLIRNKTGTSSEAATQMQNVFQKIWSAETQNKFKKFNINLEKELKKRTAQGQDLVDAFLDVTEIATKGDMTKMPQLFTDAEFQRGMLALISQRKEYEKLLAVMKKADGSTMRDFSQATNDAQGSIERMSASWDKLWTKLGQKVAKGAVPALDAITGWIDDNDALGEGVRKTTGNDPAFISEQKREFAKQYNARFPDRGPEAYKPALNSILREIGRGTAKSVFDVFKREDIAKAYRQAQYVPGKGGKSSDTVRPTLTLDRGNLPDIAADRVPVPGAKPKPMTEAEVQAARAAARNAERANAYRFGTGRDMIADAQALMDQRGKFYRDPGGYDMAARAARANSPSAVADGVVNRTPRDTDWGRWLLGRMAQPGFSLNRAMGIANNIDGSQARERANAARAQQAGDMIRGFFEQVQQAAASIVAQTQGDLNQRALDAGDRRQSFERETGPRWGVDPQPNALQNITGQVSISGTPMVTVANLPQPNINVTATVTVTEATNGAEVARQFASSVRNALAGTQANLAYQAHA